MARVMAAVLMVLGMSVPAWGETMTLAGPVNIACRFPEESGYETEMDTDLSGLAEMRISVFIPAEVPEGTTLAVYLKDGQWNWYQCEPQGWLKSGKVNVVRIDMTARSLMWKPKGHSRGWDGYVTRKVRGLGVKLFNDGSWRGKVRLDGVSGRTGDDSKTALQFLNVRMNAPKLGRYEKFEMSFDLSRVYENPFDPGEIDVTGEFTAPDGKTYSIPGFYYREFTRRQTGLGREELSPVGRSHWKVRFAPTQTGAYTVRLRAGDRRDRISAEQLTFRVEDSSSQGFLRMDRADPYWMCFDSGKFFYPVGQMLRSPTDLRVPYTYEFTMQEGEGTYAFDRYFKRLSESGVNFVRTWMGNWWLGIEAPETYEPGYQGLGKYNMEHAWKLDYILEQAAGRGIYVELTLLNHGLFQTRTDSEWYENPYNVLNGGPLKRPNQFFTDQTAREFFKRRLRYIVARWGHATHLAAWELFNEADLIEGYNSGQSRAWHAEMTEYLKRIDPYQHMTTTHFCRQPMDPNVNSLPGIEFTQSDLYSFDPGSPRVVSGVRATWLSKKTLGKGTLINEFGSGRDAQSLEANFHAGLWSSTVIPMTGTAMFWWWPWVDAHDRYGQYLGVSAFNAGEDRRGRGLRLTTPEVIDGDGKKHAFLSVIGSQNDRSAYLWVYDELIYEYTDGARYLNAPEFTGVSVRMTGIEAGSYTVEVWDTVTGKVVERSEVKSDGDWLLLKLPVVRRDVALKLKPVGAVR